MKKYTPKKKKYSDLTSLYKEMVADKVKAKFTGVNIITKKQVFGMFDSQITMREI